MYLQAETTTFAEVSGDGGTGGQTFDSENVTFIDNASGVAVSAAPALNHVARVDNTDDLTLGNFLSRPTLIDTSTWTTSDATGTGFNLNLGRDFWKIQQLSAKLIILPTFEVGYISK